MKKPKVSSVGIVPFRASETVDGLNVMMQGKPAIPQDLELLKEARAMVRKYKEIVDACKHKAFPLSL